VNLRNRIGLAGGAVVLGALTVVSGVVYPALASQVRAQLDSSLVSGAADAPNTIGQIKQKVAIDKGVRLPTEPLNLGATLLQVIPEPTELGAGGGFAPVSKRDLGVAFGDEGPYFSELPYRGERYRVYTRAIDGGVLVRVARPLSDLSGTLNRLFALLVGLTVGGTLAAGLAARLTAGRILEPVRRLTESVEQVTRTGDLAAPVASGGQDESVQARRQLVADASHELRTPLTSLTTNLELLGEPGGSADPQAPALIAAARDQARELTGLLNDLVDLGRYGETDLHVEEARLDLLAERVANRAAARSPAVQFELDLTESPVFADPDAIERAIGNLIDNAVKWSPPGGRVRVEVSGGSVTVSDQGPGIPAADLPYIFDRFYRSPAARARPGSGLGLAIVRQIAETHGGRIDAEPLPRGVRLRLSLPVASDLAVEAQSTEPEMTH
jgi:signal transduction histidine kinase